MNSSRREIVLLTFALVSCTTVKPPPKIPPPVAWAQQLDELGRLRTGKVVGIERATYDDSIRPTGSRSIPVVVPIAGVFVPLSLPSPSTRPLLHTVRQEYFRYTIQRSKSNELEVWEDFVEYAVGACLAARDQPQMIVPALPQECS